MWLRWSAHPQGHRPARLVTALCNRNVLGVRQLIKHCTALAFRLGQTVRRDVGGQDVAQEPQAGTSGAIETVDLAGSASESSEDEDQPPKEEIDAAREQVAFQLVKEILANPQTGPP